LPNTSRVANGTAHDARARIEANRHIGAYCKRHAHETRIVETKAVGSSNETQCSCCVSRPAAEASRHRNFLLKQKVTGLQPCDVLTRCNKRFQNQIFGGRSAAAGKGPTDLESILGARLQC
jgi:hypothetical protein